MQEQFTTNKQGHFIACANLTEWIEEWQEILKKVHTEIIIEKNLYVLEVLNKDLDI